MFKFGFEVELSSKYWFAGTETAVNTPWEDLSASERAALAFIYLENAAGVPAAFKFLSKARAGQNTHFIIV